MLDAAALQARGGCAGASAELLRGNDDSSPLGLSDCEAVTHGLLAQPVATVTSLAFVGAAGWLLGRCGRTHRAPFPAYWYGALLGLVGIGSVAYHGPQPAGAEVVHDGFIAALVVASAAAPVLRRRRHRPMLAPGGRRYARVAVGALGCALPAYLFGRTGSPLCRPESVFQLHGLWHVLVALSAACWAAALWLGDAEGEEPQV